MCRLVVIWRWPLLFSLLLHVIVFWPALPLMAPVVFSAKPALRGHLLTRPSPELPELPAAGAHAAVHRNVTKPSAVNKPSTPPMSSHENVAGVSSVSMPVANVAADAGGLRSYRVGLARAVAGGAWRKGLNPQARGMLEVGIAVDAAGRVQEVGLVRSSGQAELDRRLLEAVRTAIREVAIPSVLQSQSFFVALPIEIGEPISADR